VSFEQSFERGEVRSISHFLRQVVPEDLQIWYFSENSRHVTSRQSVQLWNSQRHQCRATSALNRHIPAATVRPCYLNVPMKFWDVGLAGCTCGKAAQRSSMDPVELLQLRPCLVTSWSGANRTIWYCCWLWEFRDLLGLLPWRLSPWQKRVWKWMTDNHITKVT